MFDHPDFDDHEQVVFASDAHSGLRAVVALHSTALGPAFGGCRMWPYRNDHEALTDALRLSRGMSYKAAICDLPYGGGKSVILGDSKVAKTPALLAAMGRVVERLGGRYIVADDIGTTLEDLRIGTGRERASAKPERLSRPSAQRGRAGRGGSRLVRDRTRASARERTQISSRGR
jgi:leucine dehydrogenase